MEINKRFNIKYTFNKTKNIKEGNNFNIRKKLYRNNSAEYIGYKELNKSILKKLVPSDNNKNIKQYFFLFYQVIYIIINIK